jgi:hypothetical protein
MMIDNGYNIRHNTLDIDKLRLNKNWLGVPTSVNAYDLENGLPGLITQKTQWCGSTDVVLKPTSENESAYRPLLDAVAEKHKWLAEYYRIHSYINSSVAEWISQFNNSTIPTDHKGGHCSGQIWYANYLMDKTMNVFYADTDMVDAGAFALYDGLYALILEKVKAEAGFWGNIGIVNSGSVATKIANQVTNAFGLDVYNDTNATWRKYEGKMVTYSVAPDHLILSSMTNPNGIHTGIQTASSSYYCKMENTIKGGGYYLDTTTGLPATEKVRVFVDQDFMGSSQVNFEPTSGNLPWNDQVTSIKVKLGYKATLYKDGNLSGGAYSYYCDNGKVPWNDSATSIKVEVSPLGPPVACVFKDSNYKEIPVCYFGATSVSSLSSVAGVGNFNDQVSSVRIFDSRYKIVLYKDDNYNNTSLTITSDTANIGSFNDQASSLKIMLK